MLHTYIDARGFGDAAGGLAAAMHAASREITVMLAPALGTRERQPEGRLMERAVAPPRVAMVESDRAAIVRALADEDALRVFARVVAATGTGRPQRAERGISIGYVTAHGVSRQTGLPVSVVVGAGRRLTEAGLTIAGADGVSWRTDFESLCRAADVERAA